MLRKQMFYTFGLGSVTGSISSQQSCLPVGLTHGMGRTGPVGSTIAKKVLKFERIMLMRLKHSRIRFGCTKQSNLILRLG